MKRALSLLLACVLVLALLSACGDKPEPEHPVETPPTQTAAAGGVDTSCKVYFPNDQASDLRADTVHITDTEVAVTVAYAQAIVDQLIAHDALPKDSKVLAISKDGSALSLDMDEAFRRVSHVFGIVKLSRAVECPKDFAAICETAEAYLGETLRGRKD